MIAVAVTAMTAAAQQPEVFTATAVEQGRTASLNLIINGYSNDQDAQALASALASGGQDAMLKVLDKMRKGRIALSGNVGNDVNFIRSRPTANGRRIIMVTARNIAFFEHQQGTRSRDYPFSVVVLNVDPSGKGEGTLMAAAKISFTKQNEIEIEHYGQTPVRLMAVQAR